MCNQTNYLVFFRTVFANALAGLRFSPFRLQKRVYKLQFIAKKVRFTHI